MSDEQIVDAHDQQATHHYRIRYPAHEPRAADPHYRDFNEYRRRTRHLAKCAFGEARADFSECDGPLELHHAHVEFALQNGIDLTLLERDYPGISDRDKVGAWIECGDNLQWLCRFHHRGHGGVHVATAADYEAQRYVLNLIH